MKLLKIFATLSLLYIVGLMGFGCDDGDDSSSNTGSPTPEPTTYLAAAGISVNDVDTASTFFQTYLGMTARTGDNLFDDLDSYTSHELFFPDSTGSNLIVMENFPSPDTLPDPVPVKLVFYYDNVTETPAATERFNSIIAYYGGSPAADPYIVAPPSVINYDTGTTIVEITVAMIKDPNGYILELVSHNYVSHTYFSGIGIGVDAKDGTDGSTAFYTGTFEFELDETMTVYDADDGGAHDPVNLWMVEDILVSERSKGSGLVLMQFDSTNYNDYYLNNGLTPIKLVMYVEDRDAFFDTLDASYIVDETNGIARDLDGNTMQIIDTDVTLTTP